MTIEQVSFSTTGTELTDTPFYGPVVLSPDGSLVVFLSYSRSLAAATGAPDPGFEANPGYYFIYDRNAHTIERIPFEKAFASNDSDPIPDFFESNYRVAVDNHTVSVTYGGLAYLWNHDTHTGQKVTVPNSMDFGTEAYVGGGPSAVFSSVHVVDVGSGTTNQNYNEFTATDTATGTTSKIDLPVVTYNSSTSGSTTTSFFETDFVLTASRDNNFVVVGSTLDRDTSAPNSTIIEPIAVDLIIVNRSTGASDRITANNAAAYAQGTAASRIGDYDSPAPTISDDGRYVAFQVPVSLPGSETSFGSEKVVVFDRTTRATETDSVSSTGVAANANSTDVAISGNGRYVVFVSDATNLGFGGTSYYYHLYVHDRTTGLTALVDTPLDATPDYVTVGTPSISDDGQSIAFSSGAPNLVSGDTNKEPDVFVATNPLFGNVVTVTSGADDGGAGTLRTILGQAPAGSFILFAPAVHQVTFGSAAVSASNVTISGGMAGVTLSGATTLTFAGTDGLFGLTIGGGLSVKNTGVVGQIGSVQLGDGTAGRITNAAGATYQFVGDVDLTVGSNAGSVFDNTGGTLAKTAGFGTSTVAASFQDSTSAAGHITAQVGTLQFKGASNSFVGQTIAGGGIFAIGAGASTIGAGTTITTGGFSVTGAGTTVSLAVNLTLPGTFSVGVGASLALASHSVGVAGSATIAGTVSGAGTLGLGTGLTITGSLTGGALNFGSGVKGVTVAGGATLSETISGFAAGDTLDVAGLAFATTNETVFTATSTGGTLAIVDTAHANAVLRSFALTGSYGSGVFTLKNDGAAGTSLGFTATLALGLAAGNVETSNIPGSAALAVIDQYNADNSLNREERVTQAANGNTTFHYAKGSFFAGKSFSAFDNVANAGGTLLSQTLYDASGRTIQLSQFNANGSLYLQDTVTYASNGTVTTHFKGGSFFTGKSFSAFDNVSGSNGVLQSQTLYDAAGNTTQQTQFNADGSIYLQDNVVRPAAGQVLYQYRAGTFFTGKSFLAFDNLATTGNTLLSQFLYNRDGTHTYTVPGSGLTLTAAKTDTFNVTGQNETTRFNATGFGADTFNGYKAGDVFSFSTSIFANYAALQQHVSGTSSAMITTSANDTLTLSNVAANSLTSSMFKFA